MQNIDPLFLTVAVIVQVIIILGVLWYAYDSIVTHLQIRKMRKTRRPIVEDSWRRIRENQNDQNDS